MISFRALIFNIVLVISVLIYAPVMLCSAPLPLHYRDALANFWNRNILIFLAWICQLRSEVEGLEHIPAQSCLVFAKHQSAWETIALQPMFKQVSWVLKRELLWIPLFGWALSMLKPIAIDRAARKSSLNHLLAEGKNRLAAGRWVIIFPEGTRTPVGATARYHSGGAKLAELTGVPVLPIAHNAGLFWPRQSLRKYPGVIRVRIGPLIPTQGKTAAQINAEAQAWIETHTRELVESAHVSNT